MTRIKSKRLSDLQVEVDAGDRSLRLSSFVAAGSSGTARLGEECPVHEVICCGRCTATLPRSAQGRLVIAVGTRPLFDPRVGGR